MTEVTVTCCVHPDGKDMCAFEISLSDQATIDILTKKAVAKYSQGSERIVIVKPDSPYLFIDRRGRYPLQGSIVDEKMQTVGDLLEYVKKLGQNTLSVRFDVVV